MSEGRRRFGGEDDVFGTCETGGIYWHGQTEMHSRLLDTDLEFRAVRMEIRFWLKLISFSRKRHLKL